MSDDIWNRRGEKRTSTMAGNKKEEFSFSFPLIEADKDTNVCQFPFPHFARSPLWFEKPPSEVLERRRRSFSSTDDDGDDDDCDHDFGLNSKKKQHRLGLIDSPPVRILSYHGGVKDFNWQKQEEMDVLWEDFNVDDDRHKPEELKNINPKDEKVIKRMDEIIRFGSLNVGKGRRQSYLISVLKLLVKKMFLANKEN